MNPNFAAIIKKGKVEFNNRDVFDSYLITLEGAFVHVTVKRRKKNRSNPQNSFYWGVVIKLLCDTTGYSDDEMHDAMKLKFLMDKTRDLLTLKSTALLSTVEFEEYVEKIRQWASEELSCVIPLPNEVSLDNEEIEPPGPIEDNLLEEIFDFIEKGNITQDKIMEMCREKFEGKEPSELNQEEGERLHTLIICEATQ